MTNINCEHCGKEFSLKTNLTRHLNRKVPCYEKKKKLTCSICEIEFSTTSNLKAHQKTKKHLTNLTNISNKTIINTETNNGTIIGTNNGIVIDKFINIVPFCEEVLDGLSDKDKEMILKKCYMSLHELVKRLHFNKNLPENHNLYLSNMKSKYGHVYDGEQWIIKNVNTLLDEFINKKKDDIEDLLSEYEDKLPAKVIDKVRDMIAILDYDPSDNDVIDKKKMNFKKDVIEEIKCILYNYKDLPQKQREKSKEQNEK
jgi:hypothetical protein